MSPELLRAWERRYGLLEPGPDFGRPAALLSRRPRARPADAAAPGRRPRCGRGGGSGRASAGPGVEPVVAGFSAAAARDELAAAIERFDEPEAQAVIDRVLATATTRRAPRRRARSPISASSATGGGAARRRSARSTSRRASFAAGCSASRAAGGDGLGPVALLACLPGELHELGPDRVRARVARARLAHRVPRQRYAARGARTRERRRHATDRALRGLAQAASERSRLGSAHLRSATAWLSAEPARVTRTRRRSAWSS